MADSNLVRVPVPKRCANLHCRDQAPTLDLVKLSFDTVDGELVAQWQCRSCTQITFAKTT